MAFVLPTPITKVKQNFNALVDEVSQTGEPIVIGNHSKPVAALVSWEHYQQLVRDHEKEERT